VSRDQCRQNCTAITRLKLLARGFNLATSLEKSNQLEIQIFESVLFVMNYLNSYKTASFITTQELPSILWNAKAY
jgi:hypothetical protein